MVAPALPVVVNAEVANEGSRREVRGGEVLPSVGSRVDLAGAAGDVPCCGSGAGSPIGRCGSSSP